MGINTLAIIEPKFAKSQTTTILEVIALYLAALISLAKVTSMILKEIPNIDTVNEIRKTVLAITIEREFEKTVEFLINSNARVNLHKSHE